MGGLRKKINYLGMVLCCMRMIVKFIKILSYIEKKTDIGLN